MTTNKTLAIEIGKNKKEYPIISSPIPHIVIDSKKELHGWWQGKRECTAERMIANPYNGCSHNCFYCYAHTLWGYLSAYREKGIITVCKDYDIQIAKQLDALKVASCGYITAVSDPFQPLNNKYLLTEKIIKTFIERNLPVEIITKGRISDSAISLMKLQKHSAGEVSILTLDETIRKKLVPGGSTTNILLDNITRLRNAGIYAVARLDPIFPYLTDDLEDVDKLVKAVVSAGANHIVVSIVDIRYKIFDSVLKQLDKIKAGLEKKYRYLYSELIDGNYNANINYRLEFFKSFREICSSHKITFALCMEYKKVDNKIVGLNKEFATSDNCEGINIPIYIRKNLKDPFEPAVDCKGNCLNCIDAKCGIDDLAMGRDPNCKKDWKLSDYKRWSKEIDNKLQINLL